MTHSYRVKIIPLVLYFYKKFIDRNQSDLRRSKLKSCKDLIVEQTILVTLYLNRSSLIQHRGHILKL